MSAGATEPCPEAESKTKLLSKGYARAERQICDAIINEIERQRPSKPWSFQCCVFGEWMDVKVDSSGHCDVWREQSYKKPTYQQIPDSSGKKTSSTSGTSGNESSQQVISVGTVKSRTASTHLSSKSNPKVRLSARLQNRLAKE